MTNTCKLAVPSIRAKLFSLCVFLAFGVIYLWFAPNYRWQSHTGDIPYGADYLQEWVGARMMIAGEADSLYGDGFAKRQHDVSWTGFEWEESQFFPAVYPPPHYLMFTPLASIPYRWSAIVWLFVLLIASWMSFLCIRHIAIRSTRSSEARSVEASAASEESLRSIDSEKAGLWQYSWLALLLFPPLLFSITLGQKSALWLLLYCMTAYCVIDKREKTAGLLIGLLSIKPTLFFLLPLVLLRQRRWEFLLCSVLSSCLVWGASFVLVPVDVWATYMQNALGATTYAENAGYRMEWSCNLMTIAYCVPESLVGWCKLAICLPLAIYTLYSVLVDDRSLRDPGKWMMIGCATALLSPHFYQYDLCILLLPTLWLIRVEPNRGFAYFAMVAVAVAMASDCLAFLHLPVLPILLFGIVTELRLHAHLQRKVERASRTFPSCTKTSVQPLSAS